MKKTDRNALVAFPFVVLVGAGVALAGSQGGAKVGGIPVFAVCVALAFLIQWLAFIPAYLLQTERFYDLTGSLTYITVTVVAIVLCSTPDPRSYLLLALVVIWAARLGSYLFRRIRKAGTDTRFAAIKPSFVRFLNTWTLQGLWVSLTLAAALAAITTTVRKGLAVLRWLGCLSGSRDSPSRPRPTTRRAVSGRTRRTRARSFAPACGPGPATLTTSARSRCGSAWR